NHCFANKLDFTTYQQFSEVKEGQAASKASRFKIYGKGDVVKTYLSGMNLTSVSRFDTAGYQINFGGNHARIFNLDNKEILAVQRRNGMYVFDEAPETLAPAAPAKSHKHPTSADGWHRRFGHFSKRTIKEMATKNLVDGLQITPGDEELGMCEDCIYGKQTNRPYDEKVTPKSKVLEHIPEEIWSKKRQDVSHLRAIGSIAYAKVPKEIGPSKLDTVSVKYILIGYYGCDAYKLWDRNTGTIVKARNVVFEEGSGHCTLFDQEAVHDEPIFEDKIITRDSSCDNIQSQPNMKEDIPIPNAPTTNINKGLAKETQPIAPCHAHQIPPKPSTPVQRPWNYQNNPQPPVQQTNVPPRRSTCTTTQTAAAKASEEWKQREREARDQGADWARGESSEEDPNVKSDKFKSFPETNATPAYDMDVDAAEFQQIHMENFQVINNKYTLHVTYTDDVVGGSSTKGEEEMAIGELESAYDIKRVGDEEKGQNILGMSM
ncbi:hypothetical protein CVT25_006999, partial [Psilocybe cyanescens]